MKISLSTHKVYPEIIVDVDSGEWVGRLLARNGEAMETFEGSVEKATSGEIKDIINCRNAASAAANKLFEKAAKKYIITRSKS